MINAKPTQIEQIVVEDVPIKLIRKRIKNIHLTVYPTREVRVSAPLYMKLPKIIDFIEGKIDWIKQKRRHFSGCKYRPKVKLKYLDGEKHRFFGSQYILKIKDHDGAGFVKLDHAKIFINVRKASTIKLRQKVLEDWYRAQLKDLIPKYIAFYEKKMLVSVKEFGVKKMKTRWGTCNPSAKRIWLNLELAKYPLKCLEYIVVHEMVHLLEANHSKRFYAHMDNFMADWKEWQSLLNGKSE